MNIFRCNERLLCGNIAIGCKASFDAWLCLSSRSRAHYFKIRGKSLYCFQEAITFRDLYAKRERHSRCMRVFLKEKLQANAILEAAFTQHMYVLTNVRSLNCVNNLSVIL